MSDQDSNTATPVDTPTPSPTPSDAPVDGPQQAPADAVSDTAAPSPQSVGITPPAAPTIAGPTAMPTHDAGSKWANVIKGALIGLATGGAPGFVAGAIDPNAARHAYANRQAEADAHVAQAQANVKFTTAQAASMQAETAVRQIQAEHLPAQFQQQVRQADQQQVEFLMNRGYKPTIVTDGGHPEAYQAGLQSVSDANGSVPPLVTFHLGDKLVSFDVSQMASGNEMVSEVNRVRAVQGLPAIDTASWSQMPAGAKTKLIGDSVHFFNPTPSPGDNTGQVQQYKNFLAQANALPDDDPNKSKSVSQITAALNVLQGTKSQKDDAKAAAKAHAGAGGVGAAVYAVNSDNDTVLTDKDSAVAGGMKAIRKVSQSDIAKDQHDIRVLNDVAVKSNRVQDTASALDDRSQRNIIASALSEGELKLGAHNSGIGVEIPTGWYNQMWNASNLAGATQATKDYVISILSLRESAMGLQKVLTGSARASESQIKALQNTIPGFEPSSDVAVDKLDAFTQNLGALRKGLPRIPGMDQVEVKGRKAKGNSNSFSDSLGQTVNLPGRLK